MEIKINLLPPEIILRAQKKRRRRLAIGIWFVIFLVMVALLVTLRLATAQTRSQVVKWQKQRQALETQIQPLEQNALGQQQLEQLKFMVDQATGKPPDWSGLLAGVGLNIPPDVWLNQLMAIHTAIPGSGAVNLDEASALDPHHSEADSDSTEPGAGFWPTPGTQLNPDKNEPALTEGVGELTIQGWAFDHLAVAQWLREMQQIPGLANIRCQFSARQELSSMVKFEIRALLLPGPGLQLPPGPRVDAQ